MSPPALCRSYIYGLVWNSTALAWDYLDPYANYTAFQNWAPPVPNTPQSGECTIARYDKAVSGDYGWGWDDMDCSEPHVFICRQMGALRELDRLCCIAAVCGPLTVRQALDGSPDNKPTSHAAAQADLLKQPLLQGSTAVV